MATNREGETDSTTLLPEASEPDDPEDSAVTLTHTLGEGWDKYIVRKKTKADNSVYQSIDGDIYLYLALKGFRRAFQEDHMKVVGMLIIAVIQCFGPPAVILSTMLSIDWEAVHVGFHPHFGWDKSMAQSWDGAEPLAAFVSGLLARILGFFFVFGYLFWAIYQIKSEQDDWIKIRTMLDIHQHNIGGCNCGTWFLFMMGPAINCWVILLVAIAMILVLKISDSPKDVFFDALSLVFIQALDNLSSDLGFLTPDDWPKKYFGEWLVDVSTADKGDEYFEAKSEEAEDPRITAYDRDPVENPDDSFLIENPEALREYKGVNEKIDNDYVEYIQGQLQKLNATMSKH